MRIKRLPHVAKQSKSTRADPSAGRGAAAVSSNTDAMARSVSFFPGAHRRFYMTELLLSDCR
jgi:hypothetical protein